MKSPEYCTNQRFRATTTLSFSQDNQILFSGPEYIDCDPDDGYSKKYSNDDGSLCVWDVSTGEATDVLKTHAGTISQILISDDLDETIHTASMDRFVHRMKRTKFIKYRNVKKELIFF